MGGATQNLSTSFVIAKNSVKQGPLSTVIIGTILDLLQAKSDAVGVIGRVGRFMMIVTLIVTMGAQWSVLQMVAWTAMLGNNLRTQSMTEAMTHTFDGLHPCCLCKAIAAAKKSEKKNEVSPELKRLEFLPAATRFVLIPPSQIQVSPETDIFGPSFIQEPPTPPPRGHFV